MKRRPLPVALIQTKPEKTPQETLSRAVELVAQAAKDGAKLVCLPELFLTPYFCQTEEHRFFDLAEPIPGPTTQALGEVARRTGASIVAPLFERRAAGIYHNSSALIGPDGTILDLYRKMHIPDDPGYYEKFYFTPGDLGFKSAETQGAQVGVLICWDQWYPEAARLTALAGAEILVYPTAIGWHPFEKAEFGQKQQAAWTTIQRSHAVANGCYVLSINRIGHERIAPDAPGIEFWGSSFICDPFGEILVQGSSDREEILHAELDLSLVEETRRHWPFLRDRRIDAYGPITQRYGK